MTEKKDGNCIYENKKHGQNCPYTRKQKKEDTVIDFLFSFLKKLSSYSSSK